MRRPFALLVFLGYFSGCGDDLEPKRQHLPNNACVQQAAENQIRATLEGVALCYGYQPCIESEIKQRANILAQWVADVCDVPGAE